jgi:hypothetical protein
MKKILPRAAALILCLLCALSLAACKKPISEADAAQRLREAAENSAKAGVYYYLKTEYANKAAGKPQRTTEVNLWAKTDAETSEPILNADGAFIDYRLSGKGAEKGRELWSWVCGQAADAKPMLFDADWRKDATPGLLAYEALDKPNRTMRGQGLDDFLKSDAFAPYSLKAQVEELAALTADDMDFSVDKGESTNQGKLVTLVFAVRQGYLDAYKAAHEGKPSAFEGTARVEVMLTYDRVQSIALFVPSDVGIFKSPVQTVQCDIFYLHSTFDVPAPSSDDWKVAAELAGAPKGF